MDRIRTVSYTHLPVGAGLEDLGKGLRSQVGTMYGTLKKGPRYLEMAEGYVTGIALDAEDLSLIHILYTAVQSATIRLPSAFTSLYHTPSFS